MNIDPRKPEATSDEREWQVQEHALQDERNAVASAADPLLARYRQVARALRQPLPDALPAGFAHAVAARAVAAGTVAAHAPLDMRLEQMLTRALVVVLALSAVVAAALYGDEWLQAMVALLPAASGGIALNWLLALAACVVLSWSLELLRRISAFAR